MRTYILNQLLLDNIFDSWHGQDGECDCRKPLVGSLFQVAEKYGINIQQKFLIGDRWKDIKGSKTAFIDYQYNESLCFQPDYTATSIQKVLDF